MSRQLSTLCVAAAFAVAASETAQAQAQSSPNLPPVAVNPPTEQRQAKPARRTPPPAQRTAAKPKPQPTPETPKLPAGVIVNQSLPVTWTTAGPVQGYRALSATSATKTDTAIERIPQNIVVIPRSVIDDQGATTVTEAVQNVSNVRPVDTRMIGNVEQVPIKIRGFGAEMWIDGYPGNLFLAGDRDGLANVERIEVLKGPNALLYGGGAGSPVGGTINVISKLPRDIARYEFGGTFGSYQHWNPYFDINQPLNDTKTALFRITGEYGQSKSFIDVLSPSHYNVNPTLTLTNREDTSLTIQGFVSQQRQQAYPGLPVEGTLFGAYRVRRDLYFGDPNISKSYSRLYGTTVTFDHQFNEIWSTNIKARFSRSEFDQMSQSPLLDPTGTGGTPVFPPSTFDVNNIDVFDRQREFSINPSLKARFSAGPTDNTLLFGVDYSRVTESGYMNTDAFPSAFVDLSDPNPVFPPFVRPAAPNLFEFFKFDNTYLTKAAYTQLQSTIFDRVHLLAGVRFNSIDTTWIETGQSVPGTYTTSAAKALPRTGIVFDLFKGLSLYASYGEGMKWSPFSTAFIVAPAETSQQREAGIKFNFGGMFSGTVAAFDIDRQNVPYTTAAFTGALSSQKSRGFETDLVFQPNSNWSVLASYGYVDAFYVTDTPTAPAGNKLYFVPQNSGRGWINYKFDGPWTGWSVGAGIYAASGQYVDALNRWFTPGYYTLDAKIAYETKNFRAAFFVKNLTGQEYYVPYAWLGGQVAPGAPRTFYLQTSYKFD
ncbi:MAG: TonB-dependent siderophore receptor [Bradyrhizobium sp.]|nr:TonB-dependent siderophore receptor [Bradyrhizobium sp.]